MTTTPEQQIDLTGRSSDLRYVEILTDAGIVRVNVNLVDTRTRARVVVVEAHPAQGWDAVAAWQVSRAEIRLTSSEGG